MALINQNSLIGITSITSPSASNVLTVHTNDTTERLRVTTSGLSFSGTNASLDTSGNLTVGGNVSVGGTLTYEDVTNIDSVGIITAQSGIHVTGGSVGIGTDNPTTALEVKGDITVYNTNNQGDIFFGEHGDVSDSKALIRMDQTNSTNGELQFHTEGSGTLAERLRITSDGTILAGGQSSSYDGGFVNLELRKDSNTVGGSMTLVNDTASQAGATCEIDCYQNYRGAGKIIFGRENANNWQSSAGGAASFLAFHTNNAGTIAERLRITSAGDVGINDTSPDNKLHITTTSSSAYNTNTTNTSNLTNALLKLQNLDGSDGTGANNYVGIQFSVASGATSTAQLQYVRTGDNAGKFEFKARNTSSSYPNIMTLLSNGSVGINRTNPDQRLNVSGCAEFNAYDNTSGSGGYYTSKGLIIGNLYDAGKSYSGSDDRTACIWQERGLDLDFATNDALRMKITYDGYVNIGGNYTQNNYTAQVTRIGGNTDVLQVKGNAGNSFIRFTDTNSSSDYSLGADDAQSNGFVLYDRNASAYRLVVTSAGLVGVNDSTSGWAESFQVTSSAAYNQYGIAIKIQGTSGYLMRFANNLASSTVVCGSISGGSGNATSFNTQWSDSRRKKNFENWNEEVLPHFKSLEPKKFNFTHEDDGTVKTKGFVAQDNVSKFPEAYSLLDDTEVDEKRYMFNPSGMVIYLMKALQEEIAKREALEQRLTDAGL